MVGHRSIVFGSRHLSMKPVSIRTNLLIFAALIFLAIPTFASSEIQIATKFAPIFHQALGSNPRADYITNFDFDGDWRGDNNWANLDDQRFKLLAYIYYSVMETQTHYFVRYAAYHPRDYKGGEVRGPLASRLLRRTSNVAGRFDPTGLLEQATLAHENDLEGVLVIAQKGPSGLDDSRIAYVQSLRHNSFVTFAAGESPTSFEKLTVEGNAAVMYIEPMGHGIEAFTGSDAQVVGKDFLVYRFTGTAEDPDLIKTGNIGYQLIPISNTLWPRSSPRHKDNKVMYGDLYDYGSISLKVLNQNGRAIDRKFNVGRRGSSFLGEVGGRNMARPPWGWFDNQRRSDKLGRWYFDPAGIVKDTLNADDSFSTVYTRTPYWMQ